MGLPFWVAVFGVVFWGRRFGWSVEGALERSLERSLGRSLGRTRVSALTRYRYPSLLRLYAA
ncbi:MAG: hypothetical protein J5595_00165, partial [Bacteroidales bacterium]|nr:hypothetical protein [Bacteroidales bacterium]